LASTTIYQGKKAIKEVGSSKVTFITHCETNNVVAFQLKLLGSMKIHCVFYVSLLGPYHASTILGRMHNPSPPIEVDGEQDYEMDDILDS
jgi:hypothetical protein